MTNNLPILFLDVDGVLNDSQTQTRTRGSSGCTGVDNDKCALLNTIVEETNCQIVLSSTWRCHPHMLPYLYEQMGDAASHVIGMTPISREYGARGLEIADWLRMKRLPKKGQGIRSQD